MAESIACFSERVALQRNLFLGIIGHDLRNPLQSIQVTAQYLSALNATTDVTKAARILINSGARMKALLDDLVDFNRSRLGVGLFIKPTPVDIEQLFREELDQLRITFPEKGLELEVKGVTTGVWDAFRLKQVLSNLVTNAIKYGSPEGHSAQ